MANTQYHLKSDLDSNLNPYVKKKKQCVLDDYSISLISESLFKHQIFAVLKRKSKVSSRLRILA